MLAAQKKVDFIVSLAGPAVRGDSIMLYQARTSGNPFTKNITVENLRNMMKTNTWVSYFMDYDPTDNIANTKCPVLALNGSKDCQVPADMNIPVLRRLLAKNKKAVVKEYEGLNHMFQHCQTGRPDEYYTLEETMSEEVLSDIVTWLKKL